MIFDEITSENIEEYISWISKQLLGDVDPNYDPNQDPLQQAVFKRKELSNSDFLLSQKEGLLSDFLKGRDLLEIIEKDARNVLEKRSDRVGYHSSTPDKDGTRFPELATELVRKINSKNKSVVNAGGWKNIELKYVDPFNNTSWALDSEVMRREFPTAHSILEHYGEDVPIASYSYLAPMTSIHRHTGPENRLGEYIRIHIPLIVPDGDIFFEVNGEEVLWTDIFAFDNQLAHSAHNFTSKPRLIFLIDIRRSRIGLPPGLPWSRNRQLYSLTIPFARKNGKR